MSENKCPQCGSDGLRTVCRYDGAGVVSCNRCDASGPWRGTAKEAMDAFCRPRCLVKEYEAKITQRDAQIERLRTSYQNGGGAMLDAAFAALERWLGGEK